MLVFKVKIAGGKIVTFLDRPTKDFNFVILDTGIWWRISLVPCKHWKHFQRLIGLRGDYFVALDR